MVNNIKIVFIIVTLKLMESKWFKYVKMYESLHNMNDSCIDLVLCVVSKMVCRR